MKPEKCVALGLTYFLIMLGLILTIMCFLLLIICIFIPDDLEIDNNTLTSILLVIVTGIYAFITWLMREELRKLVDTNLKTKKSKQLILMLHLLKI